jgi:hypothetical protein
MARGSTGRVSRLAGSGFSFLSPGLVPESVEAGREHGDLGFPGDGHLGGGGVREFRACFLRPLGVPWPAGEINLDLSRC